MRRITYSFASMIILLGIFAFNWTSTSTDSIYESLLDEPSKMEKLFTAESENLKENLTVFLAPVLDHVDRVDGHYGTEKEYYYTVYGKKNGQVIAQQILVSKEMLCNQAFPNLDQLGMESEESFIYCYWKLINIGSFPIYYCAVADGGIICGISPSGGLCTPIRDTKLPLPL